MVYYRIPKRFHILGKYFFLNKTFYNLARAPRFWFKNLSSIFLSISFRHILDILYIFTSGMIIIFFYINDIIIFNQKENRIITKEFKTNLYQKYKLKNKRELK
jgi:hypothetical protein